ncbi:hypothetical protein PPL_10509 [Heterostelium album PN500]|uniref:Ankyrin repeat-containing protein n=1 Tax=Heterostelium pallidum (strain ATCC 26659 / Pp 5 / PN500) TaxID=670386 RepID=D3BRA3_HETP5|nr:hypothetical protein PPL_10509 [Heterostelium album PN500]EFA75935.1 hypothetical protein PPL_10509 [Heterostelium album PN500]|eukprot:XP_020428069.1 hypothetical protein PPL_10509 [Heterostelium album PN500]
MVKNDNYQYLKIILNSVILRNELFSRVKLVNGIVGFRRSTIDSLLFSSLQFDVTRFSWSGLLERPDQLIHYGYDDIFLREFDFHMSSTTTTTVVESEDDPDRFHVPHIVRKYFDGLPSHLAIPCDQSVVDVACKYGHLEIVRYFLEEKPQQESSIGICSTSALSAAASNGHLQVVKYLFESVKLQWDFDIYSLVTIFEKGYLQVIEYLCSNFGNDKLELRVEYFDAAASNGHLQLVQWIHANRSEGFTREAINRASEHGHLSLVQFLHENRSEGCTKDALHMAACNGHLEVVQFLWENRTEGFYSGQTLNMVAARQHLHILEYFYNNTKERCDDSISLIGLVDDKILEFLKERKDMEINLFRILFNHLPLRKLVFSMVREIHLYLSSWYDPLLLRFNWEQLKKFPDQLIKYRYIERYYEELNILEKKHSNRAGKIKIPPSDEFTRYLLSVYISIRLGEFDVVKYLMKRYPRYMPKSLKVRAYQVAAGRGHLEIIKYFDRKHYGSKGLKFTCGVEVVEAACSNGYLEMVQYLVETKKPVTKKAFSDAARYGHLPIVVYLHEKVFLTTRLDTRAMNRAAEYGFLNVVKWIHENRLEGCTTEAMDYSAVNGHIQIVRWLNENRSEGCTKMALNESAKNGNLEIVRYLHYNRTEGCDDFALHYAATGGHLEVVRFLTENRTEGCRNHNSNNPNGPLFNNTINTVASTGNTEMLRVEQNDVRLIQGYFSARVHENNLFHLKNNMKIILN